MELTVYQSWDEKQVREALEEFKRQMYDGAGPDELRAGMACFDFLTRRSDLPQQLRDFIGYATDEAELRIALMLAAEQFDKTQAEREAETKAKVEALIRHLRWLVRSEIPRLLNIGRNMDEETIRAHVAKLSRSA